MLALVRSTSGSTSGSPAGMSGVDSATGVSASASSVASSCVRSSTGSSLGGLHRRALLGEDVVREVDLRRGVGRRLERLPVGARLHVVVVLDPLQREREPAALRVDLDDLDVDDVAL